MAKRVESNSISFGLKAFGKIRFMLFLRCSGPSYLHVTYAYSMHKEGLCSNLMLGCANYPCSRRDTDSLEERCVL